MLLPVEKRFTKHDLLSVGTLRIPCRNVGTDNPWDLYAGHAPVPSRSTIDVRGLHCEVGHLRTHLHRRVERLLAKQVADAECDTGTEVRTEGAAAGGKVWLPELHQRKAWLVAPRLKHWLTCARNSQ